MYRQLLQTTGIDLDPSEAGRTAVGILSTLFLGIFIALAYCFRSRIKNSLQVSVSPNIVSATWGVNAVALFIFLTIALAGVWSEYSKVDMTVTAWEYCFDGKNCEDLMDLDNGTGAAGFNQFCIVMSWMLQFVPIVIGAAIFFGKLDNLKVQFSAYVYLVIASLMFVSMFVWAGYVGDIMPKTDYAVAYGFAILSWMSAFVGAVLCGIQLAQAEKGGDQSDATSQAPAQTDAEQANGASAQPQVQQPQVEPGVLAV